LRLLGSVVEEVDAAQLPALEDAVRRSTPKTSTFGFGVIPP
jgi:hypothetical protein